MKRAAPVVSEMLSGAIQAALFAVVALKEEDRVLGLSILVPVVALVEAARAYCTFALAEPEAAAMPLPSVDADAEAGEPESAAMLLPSADAEAGEPAAVVRTGEASPGIAKIIALNSMIALHVGYMALSAYVPATVMAGKGEGDVHDFKLGALMTLLTLYKLASSIVDIAALEDSFNRHFGADSFKELATQASAFLKSKCLPGGLAPLAMNLLSIACAYTAYGVTKDHFRHPEMLKKALGMLVGVLSWQGVGEAVGDYFSQKFGRATEKDTAPLFQRCVAEDSSRCTKAVPAFLDGRLLSLISNDTVRPLLTTACAGGALTLAIVDALKSIVLPHGFEIGATVVGGVAATGYAFYLAHSATAMRPRTGVEQPLLPYNDSPN